MTVPDVEIYDPASNSWTRGASMPRARGHVTAAIFPFRGRVLVVAGEIANGASVTELTAYDPLTDSRSPLTDLPGKRFSGIAGPLLDGVVYTTGDYQQTTYDGVPAEGASSFRRALCISPRSGSARLGTNRTTHHHLRPDLAQ